MDWKDSVAEKLKEYRKAKNLNQEQLAEHFEVSTQTISGWETARKGTGVDNIIAIADKLGVSTDFLLGRTKDDSTAAKVISALDEHFRLKPKTHTLTVEKCLDDYLHEIEKAQEVYASGGLPEEVYSLWIERKQDEYKKALIAWTGEKEYVNYEIYSDGYRGWQEKAAAAEAMIGSPRPPAGYPPDYLENRKGLKEEK